MRRRALHDTSMTWPTGRAGRRRLLSSIAVVVLACGCSGGRRGVDIVHVSGRLSCEGGPMPAAGTMTFVPRQGDRGVVGRPLRPGMATFGTDGVFTATSWTPGDGLVPGTYAVVVDCWDVPPTMDGPPAGSLIAPAYGAAGTTPLEVVVPPGSNAVNVPLDVKRR